MTTLDELEQLASRLPATSVARIRPCLEVVLFYTQSRKEARPGYLSFYDEFHRRYGKPLRWYQTNTMAQWKAIAGSPRDQMHAALGGKEAEKPGLLGLEQHAGASGPDAAPPSFALFSEDARGQSGKPLRRTFVRACLPVDIAKPAEALLSLLTDGLAAPFPHSGYAGYSCYWNVGNTKIERELETANKKMLLENPGLTYGDLFPFQSFIGLGVLQVSWINLLSEDLARKLGGTAKLLARLPGSVTAVPFKEAGGVALIAGAAPQLGSLQPKKAAALQPYVDVGRLLAPARLEDRYVEHLNIPALDEQETREWFVRLFGDGIE